MAQTKRRCSIAFLLVPLLVESASPSAGEPAPLIPRDVLFGPPERGNPQVSPDGRWLSYLAAVDGVVNVWVAPVQDLKSATPATTDRRQGIVYYQWTFLSDCLVYLQDTAGDENTHVYLVNVASRESKNLTPFEGVKANVIAMRPRAPEDILIALNDRNPKFFRVYRYNLRSGDRKLVYGCRDLGEFIVDENLEVRYGTRTTRSGGFEIRKIGPWLFRPRILKAGLEDALNTRPLCLNTEGTVLYLADSRMRDTSALVALDLASRVGSLLAEDPRADLQGAIIDPVRNVPEAAAFTYARREWQALNEQTRRDLEQLKQVNGADFRVVSQTANGGVWLVAFEPDNGPNLYYLYDRSSSEARYLFSHRSALEHVPLARMRPAFVRTRDGLTLVNYLTLPPGADPDGDSRPVEPLPMVVIVHGGPWGRTTWGYNARAQWLANRGYAVLDVNFRGSTGFGKAFLNAGNKEWAGTMHDDVIDSVQWAIDLGIAEPDRIGIMGASYGGFETLVAMTFTPDVFACGIAVAAPSNLITFLESVPEYWKPAMALWRTRVGDHRSKKGRRDLLDRSPLTHVDRIKRPLLLVHGANDPRVKRAESDQIAAALEARRVPLAYALFTDEGHGLLRPENLTAFYAVAEAFLSKHLGGRCEPVGDDLEGSSIQFVSGAHEIPGAPADLSVN